MGVAEFTQVASGVHRVSLGRGPLASNAYLVGAGPTWVLVTHIHPDHSGAAGELARGWRVPVYAHPAELRFAAGKYVPDYSMPLDRWVVVPVLRLLPARTRSRIEEAGDITDVIRPLEGSGGVTGLPGWRWVHTPGHTPGHVAYLRPSDMLLISGDAALTVDLNSPAALLLPPGRVSAPPRYTTWSWPGAMRSLAALAAMRPRLLAPGHGEPLLRPFDPDRLREHRRTMGWWPSERTGPPGRSRQRSIQRSRPGA